MPQELKAFCLHPLDSVPSDPCKSWFVNTPVGVNTLRNMVSKQTDVATKYTNHSLRATATSRMFFKNVPEKIIAEKTKFGRVKGL